MSSSTRRILVINVSRIGDTLLATPAIRAIATAHPNAEITCLGHPKRVEVLAHLPFIRHIGTITKNRAPWMGRFEGKRYELAFVYGFDRALVKYALRVARKVVAFRQGDPELDNRLYRVVEPPRPRSLHAVEVQLTLPAAMGIAPAGLRLVYTVSVEEKAWARHILENLPVPHSPLIGLQVSSFPTKAYRDWPLENFIAICERILKHHPSAYFLIFGGEVEKSRTEAIHRQFPEQSSLFAGHLTLRQTAALMNELDLYLGVDTGPTHIMGSLGRPMVALYHSCCPSRIFGPLDHPCFYHLDHPNQNPDALPEPSMAEIGVDIVWDRVQAALSPLDRKANS